MNDLQKREIFTSYYIIYNGEEEEEEEGVDRRTERNTVTQTDSLWEGDRQTSYKSLTEHKQANSSLRTHRLQIVDTANKSCITYPVQLNQIKSSLMCNQIIKDYIIITSPPLCLCPSKTQNGKGPKVWVMLLEWSRDSPAALVRFAGILGPLQLDLQSLGANLETIHGLDGTLG